MCHIINAGLAKKKQDEYYQTYVKDIQDNLLQFPTLSR